MRPNSDRKPLSLNLCLFPKNYESQVHKHDSTLSFHEVKTQIPELNWQHLHKQQLHTIRENCERWILIAGASSRQPVKR